MLVTIRRKQHHRSLRTMKLVPDISKYSFKGLLKDLYSLFCSHQRQRNRSLEKERQTSFLDHTTHETLVCPHSSIFKKPGESWQLRKICLCVSLYLCLRLSLLSMTTQDPGREDILQHRPHKSEKLLGTCVVAEKELNLCIAFCKCDS